MASNTTLLLMRTGARLYADQRPSGASVFITDTELTSLVNLKCRELYDMLIAARGEEHYATETTVPIVAGTSRYNLPAAFYQLYRLTLEWSTTDHEDVPSMDSLRDRSRLTNAGNWGPHALKAYRLRAAQVEILPAPTSAVTARLQYVPAFTSLVADADTFDGVNGWEKLVMLGVAMEMRAIEEQPFGDLKLLYDEQKERIDTMATERDALEPKRVQDVTTYRREWLPRPT